MRVKILPHTDMFMRGERYGKLLGEHKTRSGWPYARVKGERSGRVFLLKYEDYEAAKCQG